MKPTEKIFNLISSTDIFSAADADLLKKILEDDGVEVIEYKKNDIIYGVNTFTKAVGIILKGSAKVVKPESGAVISTLKKGDIFGCVSLFLSKDYYVNDIFSVADSKVLFVKKQSCEKLLKADEKFALAFIEYLSNRLYFLNTRLDSFTVSGAESKVISYLLSKLQDEGSSEINISMSGLAKAVNIGRASVYRAIQSLCDSGFLSKDGKTITVLNAEKLKELLPR